MKEVLDAIIDVNKNIEKLRADVTIRMDHIEDKIEYQEREIKPLTIKFKQWVLMKSIFTWLLGSFMTIGSAMALYSRIF